MKENKNTPPAVKTGCGRVTIAKNGPYIVSGNLPLNNETIVSNTLGIAQKWEKGKRYPDHAGYRLCRCSRSKTKPYCDGTHERIGFDGTETASREEYVKQAETFDGPGLVLTDAKILCAGARFCDRHGGTWRLTEESANPRLKKIAIEEACDCPSGRLVAFDKTNGEAIEPCFEPSISLVEDPFTDTSGPIWLKGGVGLESSDGVPYETRNRVTLCRCGASRNKPFCDASHIEVKFTGGDERSGDDPPVRD